MTKDKDKENKSGEEDGHALWQMIARTVEPIKNNLFHPAAVKSDEKSGMKAPKSPKDSRVSASDPSARPAHESPKQPRNILSEGGQELDRSLNEKLRRGQLPIDLKIDLHGHNRDQARHVLQTTLLAAHKAQKRCILVVTGKGKHTRREEGDFTFEAGVLKQMVPQWLSEPPLFDIVLKTHNARQKDGGTGALYVLLRRRR